MPRSDRPDPAQDGRALRAALLSEPYALLSARQADQQTTPRLYEVYALRHLVSALVDRFSANRWQPRFPPPDELFLEKPYFRLSLPHSYGELVWQATFPNVPGFPVRSLSHVMRPDLVIQRPWDVLVLDAKYRFSSRATIEILDALHAYRDGLVDPQGREVVRFAVALTAAEPTPSSTRYYQPDFFRDTGLGFIHLPVPGQPALLPPILTLREVLDRYFAP